MERTTVGSLLRATQAWCLHLCEKETLDLGIAYYSDRFPDLPEANQFREVIAKSQPEVQTAIQQADQWFTTQELSCHRWAPATGDANPNLEAALKDQGYAKRTYAALALSSWPDLPRDDSLRILPVRPMRAAFQTYLEAKFQDSPARDSRVAAWLQRLDEPQLDLFLAMKDATPLGFGGLFQIGDIARVILPDVDAGPTSPAASALLDHALALARRLTMSNVVTAIDSANVDATTWLTDSGFVADGTIVEFHRAPQDSTP